MASINLDKLDLDELLELQKDVQARIRGKQREYRNEIKSQIRDLMAKADLTPADLDGRTGTGKVAAKYKSADGANTWSGRGRKPKWVVAHLDNGGSLDDLAV